MEYSHVTHADFGPEYDEESQILVLGSVPSVKSREAAFYYGHPQNRFWRLLFLLQEAGRLDARSLAAPGTRPKRGQTDRIFSGCLSRIPPVSWARSREEERSLRRDFPDFPWTKEEKKSFLHANHIAAWDTIAECDIRGSSDASIKNVIPSDIPSLLAASPIRMILCNGATSYRYFRKYLAPLLDRFYREHPDREHSHVRQLPSTSPANAAWSLEKLALAWDEALCGDLDLAPDGNQKEAENP